MNLEKRFFLGGEGDGLNSDYLVAGSCETSPNLKRFELYDPSIVSKLKAKLSSLDAEVRALHLTKVHAEQEILRLKRQQTEESAASLDRSSLIAKRNEETIQELRDVLSHTQLELSENPLKTMEP